MTEYEHLEMTPADEQLIEALSRLPGRPVPQGFVQATTTRFQKAVRLRYRRHFIVSSAITMLIASGVLWVLLLNLPVVTVNLASALGKISAVFSALTLVWNHLPQFGAIVTFSLWLFVLAAAGLLVRLTKRTAALEPVGVDGQIS